MEESTKKSDEIHTSRLEAFSDGVLAILITIMVLELRTPEEGNFEAFKPLFPTFLAYLLSFTLIGIYWNNHHHLLRATKRISASVMWANLYLLFWLSLVPFVTGWVGEHHESSWPAACYGFVCAMCAIAYTILVEAIKRSNTDTKIVEAIGSDVKGKVSLALYVAGTGLAFVNPSISYTAYVAVAVIWFIPDRRLS